MHPPRIVRIAACCLLLQAGVASGQTLDQEYERLLRTNCQNMGFTRVANGAVDETEAADPLREFCRVKAITQGTSTDSSVGGSSWSGAGRDGASDASLAERRRRKSRDGAAHTREAEVAKLAQASVFVSFDYGHEDRNATAWEPGKVSRMVNGVLGFDRRFGSAGVVGAGIRYQRLEGDSDGGGDIRGHSTGLWAFGSLWPADNLYFDMALSIDKGSLRTRRIVGRERRRIVAGEVEITYVPPFAPVEGDAGQLDLSWDWRAGHDFAIAGLTLGPRAGLSLKHSRLDDYVETGESPMALHFEARQVTSLQSLAGLQVGRAVAVRRFTLLPQLSVDWVHEYGDDQQRLSATFAQDLRASPSRLYFQGSVPDRNWWMWQASVAARMGRLAGFLAYQQTAGHAFIDRYQVSLGLRLEL